MTETERVRFPANVGEGEQWLSVLGGLALGWYGLSRARRSRRPLQWGALTLGGLLIARGMTAHCALYRALGLDSRRETGSSGEGRRTAAHLEQAVTVQRPVEEVYRFWRNIENWPRIMPHLKSVTMAGQNRFHWALQGPGATTVTWNAALTEDRPNQLIAWESMTQFGVNNRGRLRFSALASGETEVRMTLDYDPAAGPVGVATDHALGDDPGHRIQAHLEQFKRLMEPAAGVS